MWRNSSVLKLWQKENIVVRRSQNFYIFFFFIMVIFTGALFFAGCDLLLVIFALTLAAIFFVMGAFKASSPYSFIGAQRELIQMMAYEPMVLITAIGMYMVTKSFHVGDIENPATLSAVQGPFDTIILSDTIGMLELLSLATAAEPDRSRAVTSGI